MSWLIGSILVILAGGTIVAVMWIVSREKHEHEEHYVPGAPETHTETIDKHA